MSTTGFAWAFFSCDGSFQAHVTLWDLQPTGLSCLVECERSIPFLAPFWCDIPPLAPLDDVCSLPPFCLWKKGRVGSRTRFGNDPRPIQPLFSLSSVAEKLDSSLLIQATLNIPLPFPSPRIQVPKETPTFYLRLRADRLFSSPSPKAYRSPSLHTMRLLGIAGGKRYRLHIPVSSFFPLF